MLLVCVLQSKKYLAKTSKLYSLITEDQYQKLFENGQHQFIMQLR
jgi:hypothetical protein